MRNNKTMVVKWGLNHTTPEMIACSAILFQIRDLPELQACWALFPDEHLKERGSGSGISWHEDFENYLQYLLSGVKRRKASRLSDKDREESMREVMAALNNNEEQPLTSDECNTFDGGVEERAGGDSNEDTDDEGGEQDLEASPNSEKYAHDLLDISVGKNSSKDSQSSHHALFIIINNSQ
ncbi:hypothetical protein SERLA73DRAFT_150604 [Serpula lacrymans var. lacrymans S7.3]|uniref:Uncharacterized protein n=1 Tax=Serpula lacrymans var. lacrymans (strain S7.3) TaxID=936435 RepID=F8PNB3_SERL3|nr:hypothetical protein SERLA73DRAFT_150604 [Serpula lacrymans var. lacrymans S7.3]